MPITSMDDGHLLNQIANIRRKAREGILVAYSAGYGDYQSYDLDRLEGSEALEYLGFEDYASEAKRRKLKF